MSYLLCLNKTCRKKQMYTFHCSVFFVLKLKKKSLEILKARICNAKHPRGKYHPQSILTSQSGVTLFFISRLLWMRSEAGPCTVMGGTPCCWGWVWGAGKKSCAFTVNEALWVTVERVLLNWWVQRQFPSSSLPHGNTHNAKDLLPS